MIRGLEPGRRIALVINEMQKGTIEAGRSDFPTLVEQVATRNIVPKIAALATAFRTAGMPVFHAHIAHQPDYADLPLTNLIMARSKKNGRQQVGSVDTEPVPDMEPMPGDIVHVRGYSLIAFHGTDLDTRMRHMGIQTVVFTGVSTNVALQGLALYASDMGYQAIIPEDCTAGASTETHEFAIKNLLPLYSTVTTSTQVIDALASAKA
jgi:nicotinamidase-related amidase